MNIKTLLSIIFFVIFCNIIACSSDLYHDEVNYKGKDGEKDLIMQLDEIERHKKYSIVRVKYEAGASVPSILFLANGLCEIGKKRGSKYLVLLKEWTDDNNDRIYKVGYTSDKDVNPYEYFGKDIDKNKEMVFFLSKDCSAAELN